MRKNCYRYAIGMLTLLYVNGIVYCCLRDAVKQILPQFPHILEKYVGGYKTWNVESHISRW